MLIIQGVTSEHFSSTMRQVAYAGTVRTRVRELERLQNEGKIINLKVADKTPRKKDYLAFIKRPTHRYSTVITHCVEYSGFVIHMMRPDEKEITFIVPKATAKVQETIDAISIEI